MAIIATDVSTLEACNTVDGEKYYLLDEAPVPSDTTDTLIFYIDRRFWVYNSIQWTNPASVVCTVWISADAVKWTALGSTHDTDGEFQQFSPGCYPYIGVSRDGTTVGEVTALLSSSQYINI